MNLTLRFSLVFLFIFYMFSPASGQEPDKIPARYNITLNQAHKGTLDIDTLLLCSYEEVPENIMQFYMEARRVFSENEGADYSDQRILASARKNKIFLMGGPMPGDLRENGVSIWFRPGAVRSLRIKIYSLGGKIKSFRVNSIAPGEIQKIILDDLMPDTEYKYTLNLWFREIASGSFKTAPAAGEKGLFTISFGSCFHKIGLHNPNLIKQILNREPYAMLLLGDIAVDDRDNRINMHRSDYLLRDVSNAWKELAVRVPVYTAWDDHDYMNNDLAGIPDGFSQTDRIALLQVWKENWNNPEYKGDGIYFNTRIGPVEIIMLDTRSCRDNEKRGQYGSYLGNEQLSWLKDVLRQSTAPYKIITSGTMLSDYISNGKDSWGTWDTLARKEIFSLIEKEEIPGVLLLSGDRHGARAFKVPVAPGLSLYEFQVASLGGVPGPEAMAKESEHQLFGYTGSELVAFGEFSFDNRTDTPKVVFRLIDEKGMVLKEHLLFETGSGPGNHDNH